MDGNGEKTKKNKGEKNLMRIIWNVYVDVRVKCRKRKIAHHSSRLESIINSPIGSLTDFCPETMSFHSISGFKQTCIHIWLSASFSFSHKKFGSKKSMQSVNSISPQQCLNEIMTFDIRFSNRISEDGKRSRNCFYKKNYQNQFGSFFLSAS